MSDKGARGGWHGTTGDLTDGGEFRLVNGFPTKLHPGRQGKHIPQHNNYDKNAERSIFHGSLEDAQELIERFAGSGHRIPNAPNKKIVDFGKIIGTWIDPQTKMRAPTTVGTILYSKTGAHIVPRRPKEQ